ncbi:phosphatidylinositol N-acetylglucosaminyltransferase subunit C [Anopheles maculipalpis]|uniref:phosphatidylinositol N-acetylglucosaminyltransferase subunit C n=1 Tax=Anopheles maculipalpis TaxID=1496333 RepID=UPI0021593858|nr:phosphatidylinositol N-acetylglucosaminyltransferase subunit C [Anopheles maculipalpis]
MEIPATSRKPWKKNLYENAEYEDNYTDPSFLKDMRTNVNLQMYTAKEAFIGATRLSQQISVVTAFLIVFHHLYLERIGAKVLFGQSAIGTILGYFIYAGRDIQLAKFVEDSKTAFAVLVFGFIFSPLLHTLTNSISTDTIFSMTFFVLVLHLIFFDYGVSAAFVSRAISLNAAIFGSICLASRLSSSLHAFVLLEVAAVFFALGPFLVRKLYSVQLLVLSIVVCCYFLQSISHIILYTYICTLAFVNLFCPWLFVRLQKYKNNINGPWDEAVVVEESAS